MINRLKNINYFNPMQNVAKGILWFLLTLMLGFFLQVTLICIIQKTFGGHFSFEKIIIDGNFLLFVIAIISSLMIDVYVFGRNTRFKNNTFSKIMFSIIPIFIIVISAVLFSIRYGKEITDIDKDFVFFSELFIFMATMFYAVLLKTDDLKIRS